MISSSGIVSISGLIDDTGSNTSFPLLRPSNGGEFRGLEKTVPTGERGGVAKQIFSKRR